MKRILLVVLLLAVSAHAKFIANPIVRYNIDAKLDAKAKTIKGHEVIVWQNQTNETISDLQFHTYLNAFKNTLSTFMREGGATSRRVPFVDEEMSWGYEQIHAMKVDGEDVTARLHYIQPDDGNPYDQTVLRVPLSKPLVPGASVRIEIDWTSKMPRVFARTGFQDNFFFLAQWFPKPGVYEPKGMRYRQVGGWNCHQFHVSTEFYADYGIFDVNLTVPSDFEIASSGAQRSKKDNGDGTTTYNYYQEDIHDFAWTTQPSSQVIKEVRTFKWREWATDAEVQEWASKTGTPLEDVKLQDVQVTLFLQREHSGQADRHFRAAMNALKWFGLMYGRYPYDVLTVVDPAAFSGRGAGGMEYPTLFTAGTSFWPAEHRQSPEGVIVHEFGHQFWYGLVGNNEFEDPWLDEGFNSYSTSKALEKAYGNDYYYLSIADVPIPGRGWLNLPTQRYPFSGVGSIAIGPYWEWIGYRGRATPTQGYAEQAETDVMGERPAWAYLSRSSYGVQAYDKPAVTLHTLEAVLGDAWPKVIRTYHQRWRFKHPTVKDFIATVNEVSGRDMNWFFNETVYQPWTANYSVSFNNNEPKKQGFFDQGGNPQFTKDGGKLVNESEVVVRRLGEMRFPVVVRVRFADGGERWEKWDMYEPGTPPGSPPDQYRWHKFKYEGRPKIVLAEVDPGHTLALEFYRTNNSYMDKPEATAADKWYLRWVVWIENVLMAYSYFA